MQVLYTKSYSELNEVERQNLVERIKSPDHKKVETISALLNEINPVCCVNDGGVFLPSFIRQSVYNMLAGEYPPGSVPDELSR